MSDKAIKGLISKSTFSHKHAVRSSALSLMKSPMGNQLLSGQYNRRFLWSVRCEEL